MEGRGPCKGVLGSRAGVLVLAAALLARGSRLKPRTSSELEQWIAVQPAVQDVAPGGIATVTAGLRHQ